MQVQNLALTCASTLKAAAVKSELPEKNDAAGFTLSLQQPHSLRPLAQQQQQVQPQQQQQQVSKPSFNQQPGSNPMSGKAGNQTAMTVDPSASVAPSSSSSSSSSALPLSQLLLSSSSAPLILVPTSNVATSTPGYPKANMNAQTLVVQPLQQTASSADKGPVPIQPKAAPGHRLPVQLSPRHPPPILPAPPTNSQTSAGGAHIPVQLVGARQSLTGNPPAGALPQTQSSAAHEAPPSGAVGIVRSTSMMDVRLWLRLGNLVSFYIFYLFF